jgi:NAD(P)-dependent dehydrogenase (short-subunit alcohol dehydrogenase family)
MHIQNAVVLITGANRGVGLAFAREAFKRGARKVYAGARDPDSVTLPGVEAVRLDVTRPDQVAAAAARLGDVTLVINNAGIARVGSVLKDDAIEALRAHLETNALGTLRIAQAFAPVLARNGGGALLNVLSVLAWVSSSMLGTYAASKSAAWSLTNALRIELKAQQTQVLALHMGFVDTDLTRDFALPKVSPESVVARAFDALEAGHEEVLADDITRQVRQGLAAEPAIYLGERRQARD